MPTMLRGVRDRLRLRRPRRPDPPAALTAPPNVSAPVPRLPPRTASPARKPPSYPHGSAPALSNPSPRPSPSPPPPPPQRSASPPVHTTTNTPLNTPTPTATPTPVSVSAPPSRPAAPPTPSGNRPVLLPADDAPQPGVFRNRSLDYTRRDRQFLGLFANKALRPFHRSRGSPDKGARAARDRPLDTTPPPKELSAPPEPVRSRNDDSFSSLPSTHASRDPFLNDDVPVEISRVDGREDRPRPPVKRGENDDLPGPHPNAMTGPHVRPPDAKPTNPDTGSPPASMSSTSTTRKRSSLWKRKYDPDNEFQTLHERDILKAVALSESSVKEHNVLSAQELASIVDAQVAELETVLSNVEKRVEVAHIVAAKLPSTRDSSFEQFLYAPDDIESPSTQTDPTKTRPEIARNGISAAANAEAERLFVELQWSEKVWDVESLVAEKRFEEAVSCIEKLQEDGVSTSAAPATTSKLQGLILRVVGEMSLCCAQGGGETAAVFAPLLGRLGMAEHARQVVLDTAAAELLAELGYMQSQGHELTPRTVNVILDKTLGIFRRTHAVYVKITSSRNSHDSSSFVAWVVEQSDKVYREFVSPVVGRMKKADPVTILAAIEAVRHRRLHRNSAGHKDEKSLVALLETRMSTHVRKDVEGPIRDAEKQLMERARMYASAIPRNWRNGPYQSGKAMCDELNVLSRGLEGALMNLGAEADVLSGNLLVRPALTYCTALLEMGTKAVSEDDRLTLNEVQEGVFATFVIIGKTMRRLHQKFARIPMLERVASVLTSPNLGEVRILQAEVFARRTGLTLPPRPEVNNLSGTRESLWKTNKTEVRV